MDSSIVNILFIAACGGLGSILVWLFLGPTVSGRGLMGFVRRAKSPGKAQEVLFVLFDVMLIWATTHKIRTGKKCKFRQETGDVDEEGNPIYEETTGDEELTPLDMLINRMAKTILSRFQSSVGGREGQINRLLGGKKKGQSNWDYAAEQLMTKIGPLIDQKIGQMIKPPETR